MVKYRKAIFKLANSSKVDISSQIKTPTLVPSKMAKYLVLVSSRPNCGHMREILKMER